MEQLAAAIEKTRALRLLARSARQRARELQGLTLAVRHDAFLARSEAQLVRSRVSQTQRDLGQLLIDGQTAFPCRRPG